MIRQLAVLVGCLFYYHPHKPTPRPLKSPAHGGRRTRKKTAARHPKGLLRVGRFGSIFFTPLSSRFGGVGCSKGKGKLNTIKKNIILVNLPLRLLALEWAKAGKMKATIFGGFFVLWVGVLRLQKLVHPEGCVLLQLQNEALDKKCDKIRGLHFLQLLDTEGIAFIFWRVFLLRGLNLLFAFAYLKNQYLNNANCKEQMKGWAKTMTKNKKGAVKRVGTGWEKSSDKARFGRIGVGIF